MGCACAHSGILIPAAVTHEKVEINCLRDTIAVLLRVFYPAADDPFAGLHTLIKTPHQEHKSQTGYVQVAHSPIRTRSQTNWAHEMPYT